MNRKFEAYVVSLAMIAELRPMVEARARSDRNLSDQVRRAALEVARAWGAAESCDEAETLFDRLLAMLWRPTHPRPEPWPGP